MVVIMERNSERRIFNILGLVALTLVLAFVTPVDGQAKVRTKKFSSVTLSKGNSKTVKLPSSLRKYFGRKKYTLNVNVFPSWMLNAEPYISGNRVTLELTPYYTGSAKVTIKAYKKNKLKKSYKMKVRVNDYSDDDFEDDTDSSSETWYEKSMKETQQGNLNGKENSAYNSANTENSTNTAITVNDSNNTNESTVPRIFLPEDKYSDEDLKAMAKKAFDLENEERAKNTYITTTLPFCDWSDELQKSYNAAAATSYEAATLWESQHPELYKEVQVPPLRWSDTLYDLCVYRLKTSGYDEHENWGRDELNFFLDLYKDDLDALPNRASYVATIRRNDKDDLIETGNRYSINSKGENLCGIASAWNDTPEYAIKLWKWSYGHYLNMIDEKFNVGAVACDRYGHWIAEFYQVREW
jgi:hypothetical protein